jgi:D-sedoheptulose 7-phosphate isomerase
MNDSNMFLKKYLDEQSSCLVSLTSQISLISSIVEKLLEGRENGSRIFIMGNGGSSSTASHFVSDLLKTSITKNTKRFDATSLTDNIPVLTAWANDTSYEEIFSEQLKNFIKKNDIVIAFSGSGTSKNVVKALKLARDSEAFSIGFTGKSGGEFPNLCDICVKVQSTDMLTIESFHVMLCHIITSGIRQIGIPEFSYE